jgi:hypothetical protein
VESPSQPLYTFGKCYLATQVTNIRSFLPAMYVCLPSYKVPTRSVCSMLCGQSTNRMRNQCRTMKWSGNYLIAFCLIYLIKIFLYRFCNFRVICEDSATTNYITIQHKNFIPADFYCLSSTLIRYIYIYI